MCFAPHVHCRHAKGLFTLQPVKLSEDCKRLTLKFYWLCQAERLPEAQIDIMERPHISEDLNELHGHFKAWNVVTEHKICSGDEIVLETPDPENLPLPDVRMLEIQWTLRRLMALSGTTEVFNDEFDDDDDDGDDWADSAISEGSPTEEENHNRVASWANESQFVNNNLIPMD